MYKVPRIRVLTVHKKKKEWFEKNNSPQYSSRDKLLHQPVSSNENVVTVPQKKKNLSNEGSLHLTKVLLGDWF